MKTHQFKIIQFMMLIAMLLVLSSCNMIGSSDSGEVLISVESQEFQVGDSVSVEVSNNYSHNIYYHHQSSWALQQYIDDKWKTIYAPIADTGPPRFSTFLETGEVKVFIYGLPEHALYEDGSNTFRFVFGLFHSADRSSPLSESERVTSGFTVTVN